MSNRGILGYCLFIALVLCYLLSSLGYHGTVPPEVPQYTPCATLEYVRGVTIIKR